MHASIEGYKDVVNILIDFKVDVNAKDTNQYTALIYASQKGRLEIVEKLI